MGKVPRPQAGLPSGPVTYTFFYPEEKHRNIPGGGNRGGGETTAAGLDGAGQEASPAPTEWDGGTRCLES
jgi:hypothetical protein